MAALTPIVGEGDNSSRVVRPSAASTPRQCNRGGARCGGAGAAAAERKAGGRRGREGDVREVWGAVVEPVATRRHGDA